MLLVLVLLHYLVDSVLGIVLVAIDLDLLMGLLSPLCDECVYVYRVLRSDAIYEAHLLL
jgi:hypothetical protein